MAAPRWQRATPKQVIQLGVGADAVVARSHDGAVAGWSFDGEPYWGFAKVRAWRIAVAQRSQRVLVEHEDSGIPLSIVDARSGEVSRLAREKQPLRVFGRAIAPDGRRVYALGEHAKRWLVVAWDADTGAIIGERPLPDCPGYLSTVAISPDGTRLITVGMHGVHNWPLAQAGKASHVGGSETERLYEAYVQVVATGGRTVVVACSIDGVLHAFDLAGTEPLLRVKRARYGKYVVLVPSRQVFLLPGPEDLTVMSALDPGASAVVEPRAPADHCATSADGDVIAVTSSTTLTGSGRISEGVRLYAAAQIPSADQLAAGPIDEAARRLGRVRPAFELLLGAELSVSPSMIVGGSGSASGRAARATRALKKPQATSKSESESKSKSQSQSRSQAKTRIKKRHKTKRGR